MVILTTVLNVKAAKTKSNIQHGNSMTASLESQGVGVSYIMGLYSLNCKELVYIGS